MDNLKRFDLKERIKESRPLEEFLRREGHNLTPSGKNQFMTLCPFHDDKTPSLSVDTKKQLWHCFACNEGGDIFTYAMKRRGLDFKEALNYLADALNIRDISKKPKIIQKKDNKPEAVLPDRNKRIEILERLADIYHKNLLENKEVLEYLESRSIGTPEIIKEFKLGFSDGSLIKKLAPSSEHTELLCNLGILGKVPGHLFETFKNCIVFPVTDGENHTVEFYGRAVDDNAKVKHRYLKGKHEGVFNSKAFKVYDEIIITESVIDALSIYQLGFKNVSSSFGTQGFTENHFKLMEENSTRKVIIAYDNDEAGKIASLQLKEELGKEGFTHVEILTLPEGIKDINEFLIKGGTEQEFKRLIEENDSHKIIPIETIKPILEKQLPASNIIEESQSNEMKQLPNGDYEFQFDDGTCPFTYRLRGIKEDFENSLRVGVRVHQGEETNFFYDSINLYSAKSRVNLACALAARFEVSRETILPHLETILDRLEQTREKSILEKAGAKEEAVLTDDEKAIGLKLLNNPNSLKEVREDLSILGYIGEEMNKVLVYLIATSRKMEEPLASIIISRSSAGKSKLVDTLRKLLPDEEVVALSSASDTALYYTTDLSHKFVCLGESKGNENIEYPLRELISSKEITRLVTMKDEKTGQMKGVKIKTKGPIAYIETASRIETLNPENLNRCLVLFVDETQEQTRRILEYQRYLQTPKGFLTKRRIPSIIAKHKTAQKLLNPVIVINPYAELMGFPERRLEARRDQMKFIQVLNAVAFFYQYQREKKTITDETAKETFEYIEPTLDDYRMTYELLVESGILSNTLSDIPKNARDLYDIIKKMTLEISEEGKKSVKDIQFTKKMLWEYSGWSNFQLWKYLNILLEYELIEMVSGGINGKKNTYRVILEDELEKLMLELIPTPEEILSRISTVRPFADR
jgi:DNA primase catalytic core